MITLVIVVTVGFTISETIAAIAQPNGNISRNNTTTLDLDSGGKNIGVIWLESNKTNTISAPMIRVSNEDFWKIFGPLFELSTNTTRE
jgi:RNase H-fold protein (predicted Holliday junction resolvase)